MENRHGDNDTINIYEAAGLLGISEATARNWVRLGKLEAVSTDPVRFNRDYVRKMHLELDSSDRLKSRRNKSRICGNDIPVSYIDSSSPNYPVIMDILGLFEGMSASPFEVISYYAKELLDQSDVSENISKRLLGLLDTDICSAKELTDASTPGKNTVTADAGSTLQILRDHPLCFVPGEDTLGMLYISLLLMKIKKSSGSYYTPFHIVDRVISDLDESISLDTSKILDPACGTGNFLLRLPDRIPLQNIHGSDIDEAAVAIARINTAMKYGIQSPEDLNTVINNIRCSNFLLPPDQSGGFISPDNTSKYDVILGNPPWGSSFSPNEAAALGDIYESFGGTCNPESFSLFTEQAIKRLCPGGTVSFLLPETVLEADTHLPIRQFVLENTEVTSILYLGDVFDRVQCPCVVLTVKRPAAKKPQFTPAGHLGSVPDSRVNVCFCSSRKSVLNTTRRFTVSSARLSVSSFHILADDSEYAILEKIRQTDHFTLRGNATFCLGIVTGSNRTLLKDSPGDGLEPIVKGKEIVKYGISKPGNYISFNPEQFQQCAPEPLYRNEEKLFYRFIAPEPVFARDRQGLLSLNSANILIPQVPGYSTSYILAILNSRAISYFYRKSFRNLKVLRSALESLPIPKCSGADHDEICSLADAISFSEAAGTTKPEDFDRLAEKLDRKIASLCGLTEAEYHTIMEK